MFAPNTDPVSNIRYGVISIKSLEDWIWDEMMPEYGSPHCPECGNDHILQDDIFRCLSCGYENFSEEFYPFDPHGWYYLGEDMVATVNAYNEMTVIWSRFLTIARPCSPCYPEALDLNSPLKDVIPTQFNTCYAVPPKFFKDDKSPFDKYWINNYPNPHREQKHERLIFLGQDCKEIQKS